MDNPPKSCADYHEHVWKRGIEPIQAGDLCVCGEEAWGAEDDEWPPDGMTHEQAVALLFAMFGASVKERIS